MSKRIISDEERQRRRDKAKELHAAGVFGGAQPGSGRPKKKRASEIIAEEVADRGRSVAKELWKLSKDDSSTIRIKALSKLLEIESSERDRQVEEERHLERLKQSELVAEVLYRIERLSSSGVLPDFDLEGSLVQVGEVRAIEPGPPTLGPGESQ